jgi:8-oxo-dGTP diphosphatase
MKKSNSLYKNQGIHVITAIFTVEQGVTKVLLVKRKNEPFKGDWILTGGALYNNEDLEAGAKREIFEKTGIENIEIEQFKAFGKVDRSPVMRMVAVAYIGVIDSSRVKVLRETINTSNADWFPIDKIPGLGFDHEEILQEALLYLQTKIVSTDILKALFPNEFTLPEIQKTYEAILNKKFDRRNFRKKLLTLKLIEDTKRTGKFEGKKPAKLYKFKKNIKKQDIF